MFQTIKQPLAIVRRLGRSFMITDANPAFVQLCGYEREKLPHIPFRHLFPRIADLRGAVLPEDFTETIIETGTRAQKPILLDVKPLETNSDGGPYYLLTATDLSAEHWLEQQSKSGKSFYVGIMDTHYIVRKFHVNYAPAVEPADVTLLNHSIFDFLNVAEHEQIKAQMRQCVIDKTQRDLFMHTLRFDELSELALRSTICPIYDGFGEIECFAFSIWEMQESSSSEQSSTKLKIWMAKRDLSASQLSLSTGISLQTISKLRNGKISKPQRLTAELIASELRVDVQEIWPELVRR
ncbi:helix-turn-helix domain-containing protein [Paenibacillus cellulosilyticus]|uniref:helix-turn-helix domain-containing protein n=1 Tax=Paenibacillus cellulosilyticus TaxID=375489 RepID=UPI0024821CD8|nr:helix-turn-helix transcriptional regulator [Paenibacillus cellulosilyticus]